MGDIVTKLAMAALAALLICAAVDLAWAASEMLAAH
jgi:hypothetical protein